MRSSLEHLCILPYARWLAIRFDDELVSLKIRAEKRFGARREWRGEAGMNGAYVRFMSVHGSLQRCSEHLCQYPHVKARPGLFRELMEDYASLLRRANHLEDQMKYTIQWEQQRLAARASLLGALLFVLSVVVSIFGTRIGALKDVSGRTFVWVTIVTSIVCAVLSTFMVVGWRRTVEMLYSTFLVPMGCPSDFEAKRKLIWPDYSSTSEV